MTTPTDDEPAKRVATTPVLFAVLLVVDSLHFVFARALRPHLPAEMSSFLLLAIAGVQVGVYQMIRREVHLDVLRHHWRFFTTIGLLVAASTVINYAAVTFVDSGTASLIGKTSILFSLGFGLVWLREHLKPPELFGAVLAIAGIFIISFQPGDYLRLGSLMVLASSFFYALHTAVVKRYGEAMEFGDFFLFRITVTALFLFIFAAGRGRLVWPTPIAWLLVFIAGTVDVVISRSLYYLSLRRMSMSIHTIILTLSPVLTILWSLLLFDEFPSWLSALGGIFIILGVALVTVWRGR